MGKRKRTIEQAMIYKAQKTKDRATRIPLKTWGELRYFGRLIYVYGSG
jgi:hypothetical protein